MSRSMLEVLDFTIKEVSRQGHSAPRRILLSPGTYAVFQFEAVLSQGEAFTQFLYDTWYVHGVPVVPLDSNDLPEDEFILEL